MVLNVDINSTEKNKKIGMETCDELGIHFVNPNESYVGNQFGVKAVDDYLTQNNIDSDWIVYFEHDVAHQFLKKGFYNISFTDLMVCHDHYFKKDVKIETIDRNQPDSGDYCQEQMRFWGKHGWRWGKRNTNLRK